MQFGQIDLFVNLDLRAVPGHDRCADVRREPGCDPAEHGGPQPAAAPASAFLDAWLAAEDAVPGIRGSTSACCMPLLVGAFGGLMAAILGIGGGFVMVPAMIYLIGMPTAVVVGTSLFQICFVAAVTGFLHAYLNHSVDILLALLLIAGGVVGAQFGTRFGGRLKAEQTRILLALSSFWCAASSPTTWSSRHAISTRSPRLSREHAMLIAAAAGPPSCRSACNMGVSPSSASAPPRPRPGLCRDDRTARLCRLCSPTRWVSPPGSTSPSSAIGAGLRREATGGAPPQPRPLLGGGAGRLRRSTRVRPARTGTLGLPYGWAIPLIAGVTPVLTFALSNWWAFRADYGRGGRWAWTAGPAPGPRGRAQAPGRPGAASPPDRPGPR